jgi:kynurenine formamidase
VPAARLVGPAVVIDKSAEATENLGYLLTVDDVRAFEAEHGALAEGSWLLLRTRARATVTDAACRKVGTACRCASMAL